MTTREHLADLLQCRNIEPERMAFAVRWCETWLAENQWDRADRNVSPQVQAHMAVGVYAREHPGMIATSLFDQPAWKRR